MEELKESQTHEYVIMPWDEQLQIFIKNDFSSDEMIERWNFIKRRLSLCNKIVSFTDLAEVIKSYNVIHDESGRQLEPPWKFTALKQYFEEIDEKERDEFFKDQGILHSIRNLVLQSCHTVPKVKLLRSGIKSTVRFHQLEIASLLANAFMCTYPKRDADYPSINFNKLFDGPERGNSKPYIEKIKCIVHYFRRVTEKHPTGNVSFHRLHIHDHKLPRWDKTTATLCDLQVKIQGKIEDQQGFLQMDFANRFVGGGVLGRGCVQEEIRFVICPELIAARLFTQCLADNEALLVVGAERYCKYTGFSDTFRFDGDYRDATPLDETKHRKTYLIVLDALYFNHSSDQYRESKILRELKKAYVGFQPIAKCNPLPLATGNWGCGIFRGDPQLKSVLQLMASSQARRDVLYLTFGDSSLKKEIDDLYKLLKEHDINVGTLYRIIRLYSRNRNRNETLFHFIQDTIIKWKKKTITFVGKDSPVSNVASNRLLLDKSVTDTESGREAVGEDNRPCPVYELSAVAGSSSKCDESKTDECQEFDVVLRSLSGGSAVEEASLPAAEDVEMTEVPSPSLLSRIDCYYESQTTGMRADDESKGKLDVDEGANARETNEISMQSTGQSLKFQLNQSGVKAKNRKLIQPKITDCFFKK